MRDIPQLTLSGDERGVGMALVRVNPVSSDVSLLIHHPLETNGYRSVVVNLVIANTHDSTLRIPGNECRRGEGVSPGDRSGTGRDAIGGDNKAVTTMTAVKPKSSKTVRVDSLVATIVEVVRRGGETDGCTQDREFIDAILDHQPSATVSWVQRERERR